jgi:6-phosphogluconolactonase
LDNGRGAESIKHRVEGVGCGARTTCVQRGAERRRRMDNVRKALVFDEKEALTAYIIEMWRRVCAASIAERGAMAVALSGGRTPVDLYRSLAQEGEGLSWEKTHIFLVDERFVPHDDGDSNFRMIKETLLTAVTVPKENIHPVDTSLPGPDEAAEAYEKEIIRHFRLGPGQGPRFDLILLGLGEDGHTASLFPRSTALQEKSRLVRAVRLGNKLHDRITLTLPAINNGRHIAFQIEGMHKAAILGKVVEAKDPAMPASLINPAEGDLLFLADRSAAGLLSESSYTRFVG